MMLVYLFSNSLVVYNERALSTGRGGIMIALNLANQMYCEMMFLCEFVPEWEQLIFVQSANMTLPKNRILPDIGGTQRS